MYSVITDDLRSQVQDLQEANESAVAAMSSAEKKVISLTEENKALRYADNGLDHHGLKAENKQLHDKVRKTLKK